MKRTFNYFILVVLGVGFCLASCEKGLSPEEQEQQESEALNEFRGVVGNVKGYDQDPLGPEIPDPLN